MVNEPGTVSLTPSLPVTSGGPFDDEVFDSNVFDTESGEEITGGGSDQHVVWFGTYFNQDANLCSAAGSYFVPYLSEVIDRRFTNIVNIDLRYSSGGVLSTWTLPPFDHWFQWRDQVVYAKAYGQKVLVNMWYPSASVWADYLSFIAIFLANPLDTDPPIIFNFDEPEIQGYTDSQFDGMLTDCISAFPHVKRLGIFGFSAFWDFTPLLQPQPGAIVGSPAAANISSLFNTHLDWIAVDFYQWVIREQYEEVLYQLKIWAPGKPIILFPPIYQYSPVWDYNVFDSEVFGSVEPPGPASQLLSAFNDYYDIAKKDPLIIGMVIFMWSQFSSFELTARAMFDPANVNFEPSLVERVIEVGREIIGLPGPITGWRPPVGIVQRTPNV